MVLGGKLGVGLGKRDLVAMFRCKKTQLDAATRFLADLEIARKACLEFNKREDFNVKPQAIRTVFTRAPQPTEPCAVCLERLYIDDGQSEFELAKNDQGEKRPVIALHCEHQFHVDCMIPLIQKDGMDAVCPTCRAPIRVRDRMDIQTYYKAPIADRRKEALQKALQKALQDFF